MSRGLSISVLVGLLVLGCGGDDSPRAEFAERVAPLLEQRCASAACHGVLPGAEQAGDVVDFEEQLLFRVDRFGSLLDIEQARAAAKRAINTQEVDASTLLRKPLHVDLGGLPHYGGTDFPRRDVDGYRAIRSWIELEDSGGEDPTPLDEAERFFAETVQPALLEGTCFDATCHGPRAGSIPYRLEPPIDGRFSTAATRENYRASRRMLALGGYPGLSRLIRKSAPLAGAGIVHKGTNFDFYAGDPFGGADAIADWACFERTRATGQSCKNAGEAPIEGFVFVRGGVTPGNVFDLDVFVPGRDLFFARTPGPSLEPSSIENLTEALHAEPADIRDPAVSPDGRRVLFTMRTSPVSGHHVWELDLETRQARQLTFGNGRLPSGGLATDRDPTWGPDGSVWFVSTRAGTLADGGLRLDAELYSIEPDGGLRRWTHTPHLERKPVFLEIGDEAGGEVAFTALRQALPDQSRAHSFRFPPSLETEYHQHFGINSVPTLFHDLRELPDGRYVTIVAELDVEWRTGQLGVIDRNFGPELDSGTHPADAAVAPYSPPLVLLPADAPEASHRDPAPLPDGRLLVVRARTPTAQGEAFQSRIELWTLAERADGSGPKVSARSVLIDEALPVTDPEPVYVRPEVRIDAPPHEPAHADPYGTLVNNGAPMIDAILANLQPAGTKTPRNDFRYVRLVEAIVETPAARSPVSAAETRFGIHGATRTSLGWQGKNRILVELPLADDGSFQARVPAGVPFRVQLLDEQRMAVGAPHNRWFDVQPGQVLAQGLSVAAGVERYNSSCASCHGAPDGDGDKALELEEPDMITAASLTLSRYELSNPRRPLAPIETGDATRIAIDYVEDVQPILSARCATSGCHAGAEPAAGLALGGEPTLWYSESYEALLDPARGLVDRQSGRARSSHLLERLLGRELEATRELHELAPHPTELGEPALAESDILTLIRWIDLGASFRGGNAP